MKPFVIYLIYIIIASAVTLFMYYIDKKRAIEDKWRIKESTLLGLSLIGGALGGIFALYVIRHKNKHWYFVVTNMVALILHIYLGFVLYTGF